MDTRQGKKLTALCCLVYFASYVTRLDYAAVLVEIVQDLQIAKTTAGIAVTGSFVTYGIGMLLFGMVADNIKPRTLIAVGLIGSAVINLAMGVLPDIRVMVAIWCFNGLFQAMIWPPLTRILAENLSEDGSRDAIAKVILACQVATFAIYIFAPLLIRVGSWRTVFQVASAVAAVSVALWLGGTRDIKQNPRPVPTRQVDGKVTVWRLVKAAGLLPMMVAILLMGMLRDGLQTWMPTYICEVFAMPAESSILISGLLPALSIVSVTLSVKVFARIKDEATSGALFFAVSLVAAVIMLVIFPGPAIVGVPLFALLAGCQHGVNQMIICFTPTRFEPFGRVATFSGLLNCFVYVGAAISTYGFAGFSEAFGWRNTMVLWAVIALLGTVFCLLSARTWKRFCKGATRDI